MRVIGTCHLLRKDDKNNCVLDRVDAYGIPIYPLEPEPQATMYGSKSLTTH